MLVMPCWFELMQHQKAGEIATGPGGQKLWGISAKCLPGSSKCAPMRTAEEREHIFQGNRRGGGSLQNLEKDQKGNRQRNTESCCRRSVPAHCVPPPPRFLLYLAHGHPLAGHLGPEKMLNRILHWFY